MTQHDRIVDYMLKKGSITSFEAFSELGITKLSTRISEMVRNGVKIKKESMATKNRYGETVHYTRYSLH